MHYHVRMDRPDFRGIGKALGVEEKDFRSLAALVCWLQKKFGKWAGCWQIHGIGNAEDDARKLLSQLNGAIEEDWQWVYMRLNEKCPDFQKCDVYCFTVVKRDGSPENGFSYTEKYERALTATEMVFKPDVRQSLIDILQSFDITEKFDFVGKAFEAIREFYCDENEIPSDVLKLKNKKQLKPEDYIVLADECLCCDEEQLAARLYVAACCTAGESEKHGEALVKLADLYMNSEWPRNGGREWDVMKAVDLLTEVLTLGCVASARDALEGMREQIFEEYEDEPDVDYFIRNYQPDALCLAAFCLGVGIGWEKDVASSKRLFETALTRGYFRASHYLKELRSGRV